MLRAISNQLIRLYLQQRYQRIERMHTHSIDLQAQVLRQLQSYSQGTEFGKTYEISDQANGISHLPLFSYTALKPYIERMLHGEPDVLSKGVTKYFAKSAGTTSGRSKYLPINQAMLHGNLIPASWESMAVLYQKRPTAQNFKEKNLILGGSLESYPTHSKTTVGDVSAIMLHTMPSVGRPFYCPDFQTALMPDWEEKIHRIAQIAAHENIVMFAGVPTWNLVLFQQILDLTGRNHLLEVWPHLKTYMHGGVGFDPYRDRFKKLIPTEDFDYMEIYNASEGYFSMQDTDAEGMLLLTDNGVYYEFIHISQVDQESPDILALDQVEAHERYALVISTLAGLWRYVIGDTVEFTSVNPYRIKIIGRTQHYINVFGEEVMIGNTDRAIAETCQELQAVVRDYTVAPIYMGQQNKGGHEWLIEFEKTPPSVPQFASRLDERLQDINSDYAAKRYRDLALDPLRVIVLPDGAFHDWLKSKGKVGAQAKVPRLSNDRELVEDLLSFVQ